MATMQSNDAPKAVFSVNPTILVTMNDEMARQVIAALDEQAKVGNLPTSVYAFKCQLQNDLNDK